MSVNPITAPLLAADGTPLKKKFRPSPTKAENSCADANCATFAFCICRVCYADSINAV